MDNVNMVINIFAYKIMLLVTSDYCRKHNRKKKDLISSHETLRCNKVSNMKPNITTSQKHLGNSNFSNLVQFSDKAAFKSGPSLSRHDVKTIGESS